MAAARTYTSQIEELLNWTTTNPCNGEDATFTGVFHYTFHITNNGNSYVVVLNGNFQNLSGIGADGTRYHGSGREINVVMHQNKGSTEAGAVQTPFRVISQGGTPNFFSNFFKHVTINANGAPTVTTYEEHAE